MPELNKERSHRLTFLSLPLRPPQNQNNEQESEWGAIPVLWRTIWPLLQLIIGYPKITWVDRWKHPSFNHSIHQKTPLLSVTSCRQEPATRDFPFWKHHVVPPSPPPAQTTSRNFPVMKGGSIIAQLLLITAKGNWQPVAVNLTNHPGCLPCFDLTPGKELRRGMTYDGI